MESPQPNFQNLSELWHVCLHNIGKLSCLLHVLLMISSLSLKRNLCDWSLNSTRYFSSHSYLLIAVMTDYELLVYSYKLQKHESNGSRIISEVLSKTPSFPYNFFSFIDTGSNGQNNFTSVGFSVYFCWTFYLQVFFLTKEPRGDNHKNLTNPGFFVYIILASFIFYCIICDGSNTFERRPH